MNAYKSAVENRYRFSVMAMQCSLPKPQCKGLE